MNSRWKKSAVFGLLTSLLFGVGISVRPALHIWQAYALDSRTLAYTQPDTANDISRLNATPTQTVAVAADSAAAVQQLRQLLHLAEVRHIPVAIAGAQHSMGGHTLAPEGIRLNMKPFRRMQLDTTSNLLTVESGALWADIIPYLNRYGRVVATMQSDNAFSVGGSLSVNCHGWQPNQPPISATVESVRVLLADGRLLTCSRQENPTLFRLVLGGYGLFGIILEATLHTVPNQLCTYHRVAGPAADYVQLYRQHIDANPNVQLAYGRLNVTPAHFLEESTLNYFIATSVAPPSSPLTEPGLVALKRAVFMGSKQDAYGKQLRWNLEQLFSRLQVGRTFSRNQVMNESPTLYLNTSAGQTDILHEYFIPARHYNAFRQALQRRLPQHQVDLLNVTIRNVYADHDTFLPYAREEVFGFVLFFNHSLNPTAEADMTRLTQELITEAEQLDGTYYLPYRLHATPAQLQQAYPSFPQFIRFKHLYDPQDLFQNQFYLHYAGSASRAALLHP